MVSVCIPVMERWTWIRCRDFDFRRMVPALREPCLILVLQAVRMRRRLRAQAKRIDGPGCVLFCPAWRHILPGSVLPIAKASRAFGVNSGAECVKPGGERIKKNGHLFEDDRFF